MPINYHDFVLYRYVPSTAAAVLFIVLFVLTTTMHTYQLFRSKIWFCIPLVVGGFWPYIIQLLLLLVAPALLAATIYMTLGRIILLTDGEVHSIIKRKWLKKIFVLGDVLSFITQGLGGSIMASDNGLHLRLGQDVVIVGLVIQIIFFGFFVFVALIFRRRISKVPTAQSSDPSNPWRKHMLALFLCSILILVRSVYRVVEYVEGYEGYIMSHEWFLYVFDAMLMLFVMLALNVVHPNEIKRSMEMQSSSPNLSKKGITLTSQEV